MAMFGGLFGLILAAVWIFCIMDVVATPADKCRNLPKLIWLFVVILLPEIGSISWILFGRSTIAKAGGQLRQASSPIRTRERSRAVPTNPDDDEEFLARLKARVEEQRRRAPGPDSE